MSSRDLTLRLTASAQRQLEDIYAYGLARWSEQQAERYQDRILAALDTLRTNPFLGRQREEIHPAFRSFPIEQHIVFYQVQDATLIVHGIFSHRMDVSHLFRRQGHE